MLREEAIGVAAMPHVRAPLREVGRGKLVVGDGLLDLLDH